MEKVTVLPKELIETPIKGGVSIINENPIGVLEKLGKYEFIYDYSAINRLLSVVPNMLKPLSSDANTGFYNFDGDGTGNLSSIRWEALFPQPVKINSEAQVGVFSKGNIVNVVRFNGNNAIIKNVNYKAPDPTVVKSVWGELLGGVVNKKELSIPKDYLRKVDDTLEPTLLTGINYGANMKPQPVYDTPPVKPIYDTTLEQNATFVLTKDFEYISGYGSSFCSPDGICTADMSPKYSTLKAGTKVSGRLFSKYIKAFSGGITKTSMPNIQQNVLEVKGYGYQGSIEIPIDYLTRFLVTVVSLVDKRIGKCNETGLIQTTEYNPCRVSAVKGEIYKGYIMGGFFYTTDGKTFIPINEYKIIEENSGVVVPTKNNNKNLLMIVGAFLVGYVLFNKSKSE
jgi:hypothetical protein